MTEQKPIAAPTPNPKQPEGQLVSGGLFGVVATKVVLALWPDIDPEYVPYIPVALMVSWTWIGARVRAVVHAYELDGHKLSNVQKQLLGVLG